MLHIALCSNLGIRIFEEICGTLNPETPKSVHQVLLHFAVPCRVAGYLVAYFHFIYHIPAGIITPT
jgi:hypothetical protein